MINILNIGSTLQKIVHKIFIQYKLLTLAILVYAKTTILIGFVILNM